LLFGFVCAARFLCSPLIAYHLVVVVVVVAVVVMAMVVRSWW
jgi:hypothetical protein